MPTNAVVAALRHGVEDQGMRVVAHIDGQANAARMGEAVPADQVLEIFRPDFALRVWAACKPAGIDIPLRIHVYARGDDTVVSYRKPSEVFSGYNSDALMAVAADLDPIFDAIVAAVEDSREAQP